MLNCLGAESKEARQTLKLSDLEIETILAEYEGYVWSIARKYQPGSLRPDLVQEALIAMWKELKKWDSTTSPPVVAVMKRRASWTISTAAAKEAKRKEVSVAYLGEDSEPLHMSGYSMDSAEFSAHRSDLVNSLKSLTFKQQKYLTAKYLLDYSKADIISQFGYYPHNLWNQRVKERVRKSLEHLEDLVS
jgi:RNA polymerase sigma factor (sigma-70 family)